MNSPGSITTVVVALPFAYQDGMEKYNGIMRYLRESEQDWELRIVRDTLNVELFKRYMTLDVAGVICGTAGCFDGTHQDAEMLSECLGVCQSRSIPLVGLDWPLEDFKRRRLRGGTFLNIDSEKIGEVAAQTFLKAGMYASYGFVGMYQGCAWSRDRGAFFARGLRKSGKCSVRIFKGSPLADADAMGQWLWTLPKPAAVFASNDCAADAVLKACRRNGLRVPEDLSVLGVDDDPVFCVHTRPTLSSIHPDFEEMGCRAARELDGLMSGRSGGGRMAIAGNPTVTERMSTAPCSPAGMLVRRVDEIIEARACQNIDSNIIADELKISRRLLDLRYRQLKRMSVRESIVRQRVRRAKYLLAYSGHSIGRISKMCGYRTESYLGKVFLGLEGMSMGEYRLKNKRNN